ncbi:hypothetical protein [Xanthomonas arboricola]|uniref:hypothetical protein n=1 Tax=Xanthomonas arboricola TaxID=56448 RepID=UPI0009BACE90|nr:hypothetical protein [Xanthomonas arboricola]
MPVDKDHAYELLKAFGRLEFELKRHGAFFQTRWTRSEPPTPYLVADVDWHIVDAAVRRMGNEFSALVDQPHRDRLLRDRQRRPMKQKIAMREDGSPYAKFSEHQLPQNDAEALVVAMRRVRNNLFHGGKEDSEEDPYAEDDAWVLDATAVAKALLLLVQARRLAP